MDWLKVNLEIVKCLHNEPRNLGYWVDPDLLFFTSNGTYGFFIPRTAILFDTSKLQMLEKPIIDLKSVMQEDHIIKPTKELRELSGVGKSADVARKFTGQFNECSWSTFINSAFLKYFRYIHSSDVVFFQRFKDGQPSAVTSIVAAERIPKMGRRPERLVPQMLLQPLRISE